MNTREFKCASILTDMIENHGLIGIKTSFEDSCNLPWTVDCGLLTKLRR